MDLPKDFILPTSWTEPIFGNIEDLIGLDQSWFWDTCLLCQWIHCTAQDMATVVLHTLHLGNCHSYNFFFQPFHQVDLHIKWQICSHLGNSFSIVLYKTASNHHCHLGIYPNLWIWCNTFYVYCYYLHIFLFSAVLLILLTVWLPYTLVLFSVQWLRKISHLKLLKWIPMLNPIFDAHLAPLKDKHHYWFGFLLVVRGILLATLALTYAI